MTTEKRASRRLSAPPRVKVDRPAPRIIEGMQEAVRWARGEVVPVWQTMVWVPMVDVERVPRSLGLSQAEFSGKFGFSAASIKNWEQGRRRPEGPARILLAVIDRHPDAVKDVLRTTSVS